MKKLGKIIAAAAAAATVVCMATIPASAKYLVMGDVNKDKFVTLRDATLAQRIQIGLMTPTEDERFVADVDKNGSVTLADAYIIQRAATRDRAVLNDHDGIENNGLCPNREQRTGFYDALNAERKSRGYAEIEYNDAMMAAGQELCIQWQREREDPLNTESDYYSTLRPADYAGAENMRYETVFADYGLNNTGTTQCSAPYAMPYDGAAFFEMMKSDVASNGTQSRFNNVYNNILLNPDNKIFLIGEKKTDSVATWIIVGSPEKTD